jgi:hypothetical protein
MDGISPPQVTDVGSDLTPDLPSLSPDAVATPTDAVPPTPAPAPPWSPYQEPPPPGGPPVFLCWSPTAAVSWANHAWLRVGGPEPQPDHETFSLFPSIVKTAQDGTGCSQGLTYQGAADTQGMTRVGTCKPVPISYSCVASQFAAYPKGKYCFLGPNSNTFAKTLVAPCGSSAVPDDYVPGWESDPPRPGTFGPDWTAPGIGGWLGAAWCSDKDCS